MRWQTTAVLAALLLALGAFFYVYEVRWGPAREKAAARKGRLFAADTKDVTEVVIKRPEDTVRLKREGDNWEMLEPLPRPRQPPGGRRDAGQSDDRQDRPRDRRPSPSRWSTSASTSRLPT